MLADFIQISDEQFRKMGSLITTQFGIKLPPEKKIMFQSRLQKRLRELDLLTFDEYSERLFDGQTGSEELEILVNYISTNKTEFFREKDHYDLLKSTILPLFKKNNHQFRPSHLKIWSAGCSSGQEAFSIAITLEEFINRDYNAMDYFITATDISGKVLDAAAKATYPMSQVDNLTLDLKKKYFLKSKSEETPQVRVMRNIRHKIKFIYHNLMDSSYARLGRFDIVFLRNTLIYFESAVQKQVLQKVLMQLKDGGYLFIGHSESLVNMDLPIQMVSPSVYKKL